MAFESRYLSAKEGVRKFVKGQMDSYVSNPLGCAEFGITYEYVRANLFHFLNVTDSNENKRIALSVMEDLYINKNIDHTPEFLPSLSDHIQVHDGSGVLDQVKTGQPHLFVGFHTGPYWNVILSLARIGAKITALFPPALASKRIEILEIFDALNKSWPHRLRQPAK